MQGPFPLRFLPRSAAEREAVEQRDRWRDEWRGNRERLGRVAAQHGVGFAAQLFDVSYRKARYWRDKEQDLLYHNGQHGGYR
jgi:hypothetical protein